MRRGTVAATEMTTGWGLKTFTQDALDKLHAATQDVLRTTGVSVDCDAALDILHDGGCWVNKKPGWSGFRITSSSRPYPCVPAIFCWPDVTLKMIL